jgi:hypothetical protein
MAAGPLVVTFALSARSRTIIEAELGEAGSAVYLKAAILASKLPESGECRLTCLRGPDGFTDEVNR